MNLLMISGDRSVPAGKKGAFWYTLEALSKHFQRIDIICPKVMNAAPGMNPDAMTFFGNAHFHPAPGGLLSQSNWIFQKGMQLHGLFHHKVMTVHEYPPFYNGIGAIRLLCHIKNMGSVLELHHIVGYPVAASASERIGRVLSRAYLPREIRQFDAVRTVDKNTAARLISWKAEKPKVFVVPSFYLDHATFAQIEQPRSKRYDVVFCARLVANKGLDRVLRAIAKIPHATLLVIGDGPERKKSEALAKQLDISERVEFRGWLDSQEDVLRALVTAKVFVMNSLSEGGPRIALEAMACGLPVIATRVGVMEDVIEDGKNGFFTTGEPTDLASKIDFLLRDQEVRERVQNAAKGVLDRFEREKLIAHYARFLQSFAR
jgi:glycosyltransferase involved in cell wall biosynthesis